MANRAVPVIIQLVVFYLIVSWVVRLLRRHGQLTDKGKTTPRTPEEVLPAVRSPRTEPAGHRALVERKDMMLNGVRWQVTLRPHRDVSSGRDSLRRDVYVEEPPRCP